MKRIFNIFGLVLIAMATLVSCSKDDITFDYELPQFAPREGYYLLEVIVPQRTPASDGIYICGPFNGGNPEEVVTNPKWALEQAPTTDAKWGIYLNPADFVEGTSLADGYYFINTEQGVERNYQNEEVIHTEVPTLGGQGINVRVDRWASYFDTPETPEEIEHDGFVIYVDDQTTWTDLALYAWGDAEIFGGWPGITPTGTVTIGSTKFKYFDTGEANAGLNVNLIFNNNNGGTQLADFNATLDRDYYLVITDSGVTETEAEPSVPHDGYAVFVINNTGWDAIACYAWGDGLPDLYGAWPGVAPTGEQKINGVTYTYFDTGAANEGLLYNFIFNNNNGGKQIENNDVLGVVLDKDYYFLLNADLTVEAVDPANPPQIDPVNPPTPDPDPVKNAYKVFISTDLAWDAYALYAWGDEEMFGAWPGVAPTATVDIAGASYMQFDYEAVAGATLNLILNNNNGGQQVDVAAITADRDIYFYVTAEGGTEVNPEPPTRYIYVDDQTGWDAITLYVWGSEELYGAWPGAAPEAEQTIDGVNYKVWTYRSLGGSYNLIFNNNGGGVQLADYNIDGTTDVYLTATPEGVTAK